MTATAAPERKETLCADDIAAMLDEKLTPLVDRIAALERAQAPTYTPPRHDSRLPADSADSVRRKGRARSRRVTYPDVALIDAINGYAKKRDEWAAAADEDPVPGAWFFTDFTQVMRVAASQRFNVGGGVLIKAICGIGMKVVGLMVKSANLGNAEPSDAMSHELDELARLAGMVIDGNFPESLNSADSYVFLNRIRALVEVLDLLKQGESERARSTFDRIKNPPLKIRL